MRPDKIASFITSLRKEKNYTQEKLASMIPISRTAVSKWERGINIPDPTSLNRLREIFDVSIDEIFYGERINKNNKNDINNVSLDLYKSKKRGIKIILGLIILLFITLISFLLYYLITNYKSIQVYTITGNSEKYSLIEGIFVKTNYKIFFNIDTLNIDQLKKLRLYYIDSNNKEKNIYTTTDSNIKIVDYVGYNEYFDKNVLNNIKNMYLEITTIDTTDTIKLHFEKDYVNDNFINLEDKKISNDNTIRNLDTLDNVISNIKEKYKMKDDAYVFNYNNEDNKYEIMYIIDANLIIVKKDSKKITEEWVLYLDNAILDYNGVDDNKLNNLSNININELLCDEQQQNICNIVDEFWRIIDASFK